MLGGRGRRLPGKRRYRAVQESDEGIEATIVADRLARLERWGIVESRADPENRRAKLYEPTAKGLDLAPLLLELIIWGGTHDPHTDASPGWIRSAKRDRAGTIARIRGGDESPS